MRISIKTSVCILLIVCIIVMSPSTVFGQGQKDHLTAFLLSLAVPGLGQYYAGSPGYAKLFITAELAIWGGYHYNKVMKDVSKQDYLSYAALHAGVNPQQYGTTYINAVGAFDSSFEYNAYQQQTKAHPVLYSSDRSWNWDSRENRVEFKSLREHELDYENNIKYCIAGAVLNHFISGLNAYRIVRNQTTEISMISVGVLDHGLSARITRSF